MKTKITRFAFAGKCGDLGDIGFDLTDDAADDAADGAAAPDDSPINPANAKLPKPAAHPRSISRRLNTREN